MLLAGKVAMVTGASRGIGREVAIEMAKAGADIVINYIGDITLAQEVQGQVEALGRKAVIIETDVSNSAAVDELMAKAIAEFSRIDILVNNAGITRDNLLARMKEEDWDAVMNVNLKSMFNCSKSVLKYMMKQRYGRIINISSVVGVMGNAGQANYAAAKAGALGLTKSIAKEVASRNITVNAVAPGFIDTEMTANLPDKVKEEMLSGVPIKRLGLPLDIANAIIFLASDNASYITGQTLHIDGGMIM